LTVVHFGVGLRKEKFLVMGLVLEGIIKEMKF
jgi:hypothetical protein